VQKNKTQEKGEGGMAYHWNYASAAHLKLFIQSA